MFEGAIRQFIVDVSMLLKCSFRAFMVKLCNVQYKTDYTSNFHTFLLFRVFLFLWFYKRYIARVIQTGLAEQNSKTLLQRTRPALSVVRKNHFQQQFKLKIIFPTYSNFNIKYANTFEWHIFTQIQTSETNVIMLKQIKC